MPYLPEAPLPDLKDWNSGEWWQRIKRHEFTVQRCSSCRTFRHPPNPVCYVCRSFDFEWTPVSGKGVIYSYTIGHHPPNPSFVHRVPYGVILVELPDAGNVRMLGNLLDTPLDQIKIGTPVEVVFDDISPEITLPQWRRAKR